MGAFGPVGAGGLGLLVGVLVGYALARRRDRPVTPGRSASEPGRWMLLSDRGQGPFPCVDGLHSDWQDARDHADELLGLLGGLTWQCIVDTRGRAMLHREAPVDLAEDGWEWVADPSLDGGRRAAT